MTDITMTDITAAGSFRLCDRTVNRMGYGAMQLAGRDATNSSGAPRAMFPVQSLFCARPSPLE